MNKKTFAIILSLVLLVSFFLPYLGDYSGFDLVFGKHKIISSSSGIASILIPAGGIMILFGNLFGNTYNVSYWMPIVGVIVLVALLLINGTGGAGIGDIISSFSYGFWITLVASVLLLFAKD